jgi:hypothetical protein
MQRKTGKEKGMGTAMHDKRRNIESVNVESLWVLHNTGRERKETNRYAIKASIIEPSSSNHQNKSSNHL